MSRNADASQHDERRATLKGTLSAGTQEHNYMSTKGFAQVPRTCGVGGRGHKTTELLPFATSFKHSGRPLHCMTACY